MLRYRILLSVYLEQEERDENFYHCNYNTRHNTFNYRLLI